MKEKLIQIFTQKYFIFLQFINICFVIFNRNQSLQHCLQKINIQINGNLGQKQTKAEFKFIYNDLKQQIKQLQPLQNLLRLTQKSTKKLQCLNLYSITDKRDFDLQLEQKQILSQILQLSLQIKTLKQSSISSSEQINETNKKIEQIKDKNILIFDLLNKQDQLLSQQIQLVEYWIDDQNQGKTDQIGNIKIKQQDQFEYQHGMKQSSNVASNPNINRVEQLKKQIDEIGNKISKINNGKGKWFVTDHNDFVKIYNKCAGNDKKIIEQGIKILGMKSTQIMDHLQLYDSYLQLEKQKKIISQQYRQIKLYQKIQEQQKIEQQKKLLDEKKKFKKQKQIEQNQKKKELIQKFKQKKQQEKTKLIQQQQKKQKQKIVKVPLPPSKKKQIIDRNQKYILQKQANFKKNHEKIQAQEKNQQKSHLPVKSSFSVQKQSNKNKINSRSLAKTKKAIQSQDNKDNKYQQIK